MSDYRAYHGYAKCPKCDLGLLRIVTRKGTCCDICGYPFAYTEKFDAKITPFDNDREWLRLKALCPACNTGYLYKKIRYALCYCFNCKKFFDGYAQEISPGEPLDKYKEATMQDERITEVIAEHFPKTEDAMLVAKWFNEEINRNPKLFDIFIVGHEEEMLVKAKELEKAEKERAK